MHQADYPGKCILYMQQNKGRSKDKIPALPKGFSAIDWSFLVSLALLLLLRRGVIFAICNGKAFLEYSRRFCSTQYRER